MATFHWQLAGKDLHPPGWIQSADPTSTDPGMVEPGQLWIDTTDPDDLILRVRNDAGSAWLLIGTPGLVFMGAWSSETSYEVGDVVTHSGSSYVATAAHSASEPPSANWTTLAAKGEKGETGDTGPAGEGVEEHRTLGVGDHDNVDLTGAAENDGFIRNASGIYVRKPYASQAEAEAGTEEGKWMSPLRTAQAIAALGGGGGAGFWSLLAEETLSASGAFDFASLPDHKLYRVRVYGECSSTFVDFRFNGDTGSNYISSRQAQRANSTNLTTQQHNTSLMRVSLDQIAARGVFVDFVVGKQSTASSAYIKALAAYTRDISGDPAEVCRTTGMWNNASDLLSRIASVSSFAAGSYAQVLGFVDGS